MGLVPGTFCALGSLTWEHLAFQVTLDMQQYMNIAVRRVLSNEEELVKEYNVTTFPSAYLLVSNGSFSRISV